MLSDALKKMSGCEPDIICITHITCESVNNAMLIYKGRLGFYHFDVVHNFSAFKHWLQFTFDFLAAKVVKITA